MRIPLGMIDVGARGDIDSALTQLAGVTKVLGFEPDRGEAEKLQAKGSGPWASFAIEPVALAERDGPATLYLTTEPNNHSLRPTDSAFVRRYGMEKFVGVGQLLLETTTLDGVIFERRPSETSLGEVLKVDTQGTELDILKGAVRTLRERTQAIVCEVEFAPIYLGQPLFADVERFLRDQGFAFFGFSELHARSRKRLDKAEFGGRERLLWSDAIFFKDPIMSSTPPAVNDRRGCCLIAVALMCGFYDYVIELAEWMSPALADGPAFVDGVVACIRDIARIDQASAREDVEALARAVAEQPALANILVGQFVDRRRRLHDYDDVRQESRWLGGPQTLLWEPDVN